MFDLDVRDALGANLVNTVGELLRPVAEQISGGTCLMSILTNASEQRLATAEFRVPVRTLARAGFSGEEMARRVVKAASIAQVDTERAVTHNKGIMNGITALALATGNDTRALEAAVHRYAAKDGRYRALSTYKVVEDQLYGAFSAPIALATVGGATDVHPCCQAALRLLGSPGAAELAAIAASLGLAQNFAALHALCAEGIQRGHMNLHASRMAWAAGARGAEIGAVVGLMREADDYTSRAALRFLTRIRESNR